MIRECEIEGFLVAVSVFESGVVVVRVHRKPGGGEEVGDCQLALSPTTIKVERIAGRQTESVGCREREVVEFPGC